MDLDKKCKNKGTLSFVEVIYNQQVQLDFLFDGNHDLQRQHFL